MHKCTLPSHLPKDFPRQLARKCRQNGKSLNYVPRPNEQRIRPFSVSRARSTTLQTDLATTKHEALTLQHKTENLLEPVFKVAERPSNTGSSVAAVSLWRDVLSDTFENLSTGAERPARVVVYSMDEWSGADDLVTALLDEPLSSDQTQENVLRTRWQNAGSKTGLTISTNPANPSPSSVRLSSSYLRQFSVPLEITELRAQGSPQTLPSALFKADVPIIVFNPLTTSLSSLRHLTFPSHTLFIASSNPHLNDNSSIVTQLLSELPQFSNSTPPRILFIDPSRALSAIQAFRSNPTSALAIQQYQDNFTGSGISLLTNTIRSVVDSGKATASPAAYLRNRTAIIQLHDALRAFYSTAEGVQKSLDDIRQGVSQLTCKVEEAKVRVPNDILHSSSSAGQPGKKRGEGDKEQDIVGESLRLASKEMKNVLERLTWWKTIWKVDEVSGIVGGAVDRVWCKDLEQKLILQTGRLLSLQQEITTSAFLLVQTQTPPSPSPRFSSTQHALFTANILKNTLSQLTSSPTTYALTPSTLTLPTTKRKHQLLAYPTTRLHLKAQRLVLGMSSGIAASSGFTWAGWMGHLSQSVAAATHANETTAHVGSAIWSTVGMGMDPVTGIGVGLLGVVGSLRWVVGKWEKEKRKWWSDWERIGKGLERDLKATVDTVMKDQVIVVADAACKGLQDLCEKRQEEVDEIKDKVVQLQTQLKDITSRSRTQQV